MATDETTVTIPPVRCFAHVAADKEHALKPLEEASEVHEAWKHIGDLCVDTCDECDHATYRGCIYLAYLVDECCDVIQATCNLLAALGVTDLTDAMAACERRNEEGGRYE